MSFDERPNVLTVNVAKDRIITRFPQAYNPDASPYKKTNFSVRVRETCHQHKTGTVGLKICKAVIVGDVAVGKSCLVNRFCHDVFDKDYKATIGVDFEVEKFAILNTAFNLQIWDTAGQERFKCIAASYYRGANVVIVVFDMSDIGSLSNALQWRDDACRSAADPLVFLVGTKKDLLSDGASLEVEIQAASLARDMGAELWVVSSKNGENVKEFFFRLVALTFDNAVMNETQALTTPAKQIGSDLIKLDKNSGDIYDHKTKSSGIGKCCS